MTLRPASVKSIPILLGLACIWSSAHLATGQDKPAPPPNSAAAPPSEPPAEPSVEPPPPPQKTEPKDAPAKQETKSAVPVTEEIEDAFTEVARLAKTMEIIRKHYVDGDKVSYDKLITGALRGMLQELDPHSQYIAPQVFQQIKHTEDSMYEGVGFSISPRMESLVVVTVREDGPAARAGILPGDAVLRIGERDTLKLGYLEALGLLQGNPGEKISLTILRPSTSETKSFTFLREMMRQDSVRDAMILDPALVGGSEEKIGYIRLMQFGRSSARELEDALNLLEGRGMQALVLDLRNNPGGLLNVAVDILSEFVAPNTTVVTTEGRNGEFTHPPYKTVARKHPLRKYPLAILVNNGSASASELVAAALQDLKRAVIVGVTTFGKGSVQNILPGEGGTAIRITTAKYYTPSHRTIHEKGVIPDILSTLTPADEGRIFQWRRDNPKASSDPAKVSALKDLQLERAAVALRGVLTMQKK